MPRQSSASRKEPLAFDRLGTMVREAATGEVSVEEHLAGRARLVASLTKRAPRRIDLPRWMLAAAAVAAAAVFYMVWPKAPPALSWQVEGQAESGSGTHAEYVAAKAAEPSTVRFSDGSVVALAPGSRGRLGPVVAHEAHVALESGRMHARLGAVARLSWIIDAGPFAITTSAATADVAWSGRDEMLDIRLQDGQAVVRGPLAADGVTVGPGQHLVARVQTGSLRLDAEDAAPAAAPASSAWTAVGPADLGEIDPSAPPAAPSPSRPTWTERVAHGDFDGVLDDARGRGLETTATTSPLPDSVALADAARYRGKSGVARRALLAERTRFASSTEAKTAAFLLGRLAEDADHSPSDALAWYGKYLVEAPRGPFAAEASGRRLAALAETQGPEAARGPAQDYLRRYPTGAYAPIARDILRGASPPPPSPPPPPSSSP